MKLSKHIGKFLQKNQLKLITAESCTAGLISSTIAKTPGSSAWLEGGFIVYTPEAKNKFLGVSLNTIKKYNITSCEVAKEMSHGAIQQSVSANAAVAITGVAGPGGGTKEIPVGTVCISWAFLKKGEIISFEEKVYFQGKRNTIRKEAVNYILSQLENYWDKI